MPAPGAAVTRDCNSSNSSSVSRTLPPSSAQSPRSSKSDCSGLDAATQPPENSSSSRSGWRTPTHRPTISATPLSERARGGWQAAYWTHQAAACRNYDVASTVCKVVLLLGGNVRRSIEHKEVQATVVASGAACVVALTLCVMLLRQEQYAQFRRVLMWSNLAAISIMMATSMNQFLTGKSPQLWPLQMLVLLFKMGVTWPIMAALMHRLPWQDLAVMCGAFCIWLCCTWARPLCVHLHSSPGDAAFVRSLAAALDTVTGLGMDTGAATAVGAVGAAVASGSGMSSAGGVGGFGPAAGVVVSSSSSAMQGGLLSSAGSMGSSGTAAAAAASAAASAAAAAKARSWAPLAHHIAAECLWTTSSTSSITSNLTTSIGSSSLSPALSAQQCESLVMGQCMAVVTSLTLWVGVSVILFFVILNEQHSKWRWWHSSSARWQQQGRGASARTPFVYTSTSVWGFLAARLLYLHVLLDVPLLLLWVGSSSWYRGYAAQALGSFNLW